jgi:hypothetical protein
MASNTTTYNVDVDIDVKTGKVEDSIGQLKALKKQLKDTAAGSEEFSKLQHQITELEINIKGAKKAGSDWIATLEGAGGPLGALGGALAKVKASTVSFSAALKATGIGLVVAAISGLVGAFAETDGAMKKLEPLMIAMQKIFGGIFEALQPLIDGFVELATQALPYITQGIKVFYSSLVALFTLVKEGGGGIAKILQGIFTLDNDKIKEGYAQLTGTWSKTVEAFDATEKRFDAGYAKKTKKEKERDKDAEEKRKEALAKRLKDLDDNEKISEAQLHKEEEIALGLAKTEQEKFDVQTAFAAKRYELQKKELEDKLKLLDPKKDKDEYKQTQAALTELDANRLKDLNAFAVEQKKLLEDELKAQKDFNDKREEILAAAVKDDTERAKAQREAKYNKDLEDLQADKEFIKLSAEEKFELEDALLRAKNQDLAKIDRDAKIQAYSDDLLLLQAQQKTLTEGTQSYLDNSIAIENDAYAIKIANAKDNAKQIEAIKIEHEQNLKDIQLKAAIAEKQIQLDRLNVIAGIGNSLAQLAGKNKALAIAAIAIEKAAAIGSIIVNTQIANLKAVAASPLTFGQPWVTINTIAGALGVAAAVASGIQAVQQINAVQIPGSNASSGGSAGGGAVAMPAAPSVGSTAAPQITGTTGGNNPTTQIAQTLAGATNKPIRAYVVSGDVSSQQALDRRTSKAATF